MGLCKRREEMNLCNYNWNTMAMEILQDYEVYTSELNTVENEGLEGFSIESSIGYDAWLERKLGKKTFIYIDCGFIGGDPDVFTVHYNFNSKDKEMEIEFYGSGW